MFHETVDAQLEVKIADLELGTSSYGEEEDKLKGLSVTSAVDVTNNGMTSSWQAPEVCFFIFH